MTTLANGGRINLQVVKEEINRLQNNWQTTADIKPEINVDELVETPIDLFEQYQLTNVIQVCKQSNTAAEAGRKLFNVSRLNKTSVNDSHRVSQFLNKFNLDFKRIKDDD